MIRWEYEIDGELVEEPRGWADIVLQITRDPDWNGIFFEAATSTLGFYGRGAEILMAKKAGQMLAATATLTVRAICGEEVDVLQATLNFGVYEASCGTTCIVNIGVEKVGCTMTLRNRFDQKVDLSDNIAFDKQTVLQDYPGLNFEMEIPAQEINIGDHVTLSENKFQNVRDLPEFQPGLFSSVTGYLVPPFDVEHDASLGVFNYSVIPDFFAVTSDSDPETNAIPYPSAPIAIGTAELLGTIRCAINNVEFSYRLKGHVDVVVSDDDAGTIMTVRLLRLPVGSPEPPTRADWVLEYEEYIIGNVTPPHGSDGDHHVDFDKTVTMPLTLNQGDFLYFGIYFFNIDQTKVDVFDVTFEDVNFFKISGASVCEDTTAIVSLVNETGSRIIESVTDGCLRMKSDYYGRTDSLPYESDEDGCGSLRVLTSGLRLRNASNPVHFISPSDFFKGLRGIDNIGLGIETDQEFPMREWVRVEPVEYFFDKTKEIMRINAVPFARFILDPSKGYSIVKIGYTKWEVENVNGLDEFNSNKEFRTGLTTINNTLDAQSNFVAGGYPIEVTRQQSFAASGGADTSYDNETFIICVERDAYGFHVEQGNIIAAANLYSPSTAYNWRIRPFYNLMRWWKSVAQSYASLAASASKLFFSSGTGNLLATGRLPPYDPCDLAAGAYPENDDLDIWHFTIENLPIFKPERVVFAYPMSLRDYLTIKAAPYGYISVQCGNGTFVKGFILDIQYRPADGLADFNLQISWDTA